MSGNIIVSIYVCVVKLIQPRLFRGAGYNIKVVCPSFGSGYGEIFRGFVIACGMLKNQVIPAQVTDDIVFYDEAAGIARNVIIEFIVIRIFYTSCKFD